MPEDDKTTHRGIAVAEPTEILVPAAPAASELVHASPAETRLALDRAATGVAAAGAVMPAARAALDGLVDAVPDAFARERAARWNGRPVDAARGAPGGPPEELLIEGPVPLALEGPRTLLLGAAAGTALAGGAAATTVPALRTAGALALPEARVVAEPRWLKVYSLPRYQANQIRALGRQILSGFPCFSAQIEAAEAAGEDPLGFVSCLVSPGGMGPSSAADLGTVSRWIVERGNVLGAAALDVTAFYENYRPEIVFATGGERSFLMVRERRENGAADEGHYVYSWTGGDAYYADPRARSALDRILNGEAPIRARPLPGMARRPAPGLPAPAGARRAVAGQAAATAVALIRSAPSGAAPRPERSRKLAALPSSQGRGLGDLARSFREAGFALRPDGDAISYARDVERGVLKLRPLDGLVANRSTGFRAILAADGEEAPVGEIRSAADLEAVMASLDAAALSPGA